jgi:hypothetical protein
MKQNLITFEDEYSNLDNTLEERNLHKLMKKKFAAMP